MNEKRYITQENINSKRGIKLLKKIEKNNIAKKDDIILIVGTSFTSCVILTKSKLISIYIDEVTEYKLNDIIRVHKKSFKLILCTKTDDINLKYIPNDNDIKILNEYIKNINNTTYISQNVEINNIQSTPSTNKNNDIPFYLSFWFKGITYAKR